MNAGKTKLMGGGGGGGVVSDSELGASPCAVCNKGVAANSVQGTSCMKWVHRTYSAVKAAYRQRVQHA